MKLKNNALQELYDTIVNGTLTFSPGEASPIDKVFKECDEKLSESITFATIKDLQDRNDILEESNKSLLAGNLNLSTEKRILKNRISRFEELLLDANTNLEKVNADRTNLQEVCDKLSEEKKRLNARIDCLRLGVKWYRKRYKEQSDKINELTKNYQDLSIKLKRYQIDVGRESRYLWDMLQEVSDYYYFGGDDEFDTDDCEMTSMTDIIDNLNVNQFLEAYKNWHKAREQHRWKYEPIARRLPQPWTCTLEGTINVEINKDLLNKVCGIDSDD